MQTKFQRLVYSQVKRIPKGKTKTYKEIAEAIGYSLSWRAVANALNKNRDPRIPCQRVIRSDGTLGGYNKGRKAKLLLLRKEKATL